MSIFHISLILTTLLCSLVAGFLFAFAIVVMPGIRSLNDREFIRAFQVMDRVIQNNQPIFSLVWAGSIVALMISAVLGMGQLDLAGRLLILFAAIIYLFGVQLPTLKVNIPLNNKIQAVDVDALSESTRKTVRKDFEPRWNLWNTIRTANSSLVSALLIILIYMI